MAAVYLQTAVDAKHHLIVAHEVTNVGTDRSQLYNMARQAKEALGVEKLEVVADRGYYKGEEILACEQDNITTFLPKPQTSRSTRHRLRCWLRNSSINRRKGELSHSQGQMPSFYPELPGRLVSEPKRRTADFRHFKLQKSSSSLDQSRT